MTWTEVFGFVTGALCVWLTVRRNVWNFPVGLASSAFYLVVFADVGLYGDAALQVVYLVLTSLGWYWWLRGGTGRAPLPVQRTPRRAWPVVVLAVALLTWAVYVLLASRTDSTVPLGDALTTALSLAAQAMLNRKWIGHWLLWIAADVLYVGLYLVKGLELTAVLYALFLAMCLVGVRQWRTELAQHSTGTAGAGAAPGQGASDGVTGPAVAA